MKKGLYTKLAWTGIKKNKRMYLPYILTYIGMVTVYYIIASLSYCPLLENMSGGSDIGVVLSFGKFVIAFFSLIFLFYTNSFLIRRRKKEFGLYNILGMGKRNIGKILFMESLIVSVIGTASGLGLGIALSKFAELGLLNALRAKISYSFFVSITAIIQTIVIFAIIFVLILLRSLLKIRLSNPISLLHSENLGEKPPKGNWIIAIIGVLLLAGAYYISVTIKSPLSALGIFFVAVLMVIAATYMLFITGSVVLCRLLQKKKNYYYKPEHFVSISSMVYRMKRNGAGLASICILSTMVLVTLSSTSSLYLGADDSLKNRYPRSITMDVSITDLEHMENSNLDSVRDIINQAPNDKNVAKNNVLDYRMSTISGLLKDDRIQTDVTLESGLSAMAYDSIRSLFIISLDDYNRIAQKNETLKLNEVLLYCSRTKYKNDTIQIANSAKYNVKAVVPKFVDNGISAMQVIPSIFVVVPDFDSFVQPLISLKDYNGEPMISLKWFYGFDINAPQNLHISINNQINNSMKALSDTDKLGVSSFSCESAEEQRTGFYSAYGGLFFIGIMLSAVFAFAAILIIYYKQISEGYEDLSRFDIMKKVGMTSKNIRKSINSQILTVFFLPLIFAGLHLAFAFPLVWKILLIFNLRNLPLAIIITIASYLIFCLIYCIVYKVTSNAYYSIVSKDEKQ